MQNVALRPFLTSIIDAAGGSDRLQRPPNDVTIIPEPKCTPVHLDQIRKTTGWKVVGLAHRVATTSSRSPVVNNFVHGGIIAVNHRPGRVAMGTPRKDSRGVVSVGITVTGAQPIAVIGAYVPCSGPAEYKTDGLVEGIFTKIEEEYRLAKQQYPSGAFIAFDVNGRLGEDKKRKTADTALKRGFSDRLRQMCRTLGVSPVYGRPGMPPGYFTSRCPNGSAGTRLDDPDFGYSEIDYILVDDDFPLDRLIPHAPQPWADIPTGITHRMQYLTIKLEPDGTGRPPALAPRGKSRWPRVPHYDDILRHHAAAMVLEGQLTLPRNADLFSPSTAATGHERYTRLAEIYRKAAEAADPDDTMLRERQTQGRAPAPRLYKGKALPRQIVAGLKKARAMRLQARSLAARVRTVLDRHKVDELTAQARAVMAEAQGQARQHLDTMLQKTVNDLEHKRVHNPSEFHKTLQQLLPENAMDAEEEENTFPGADAPQRFHDFYRKQYAETRTPATAPGEQRWLFPGAGPPGPDGAPAPAAFPHLADPFTPREEYMRIFPPCPSVPVPRCVGGGANCVICAHRRTQHWAARVQGWDSDAPDAVEVPCTPVLSTTSCGGPDGEDPRTIRQARHEDPSQRRRLRDLICAVETAMFNVWMLREGRVPEPVAECLTTLILKRDKAGNKLPAMDPSSYRGITMGNVIAKKLAILLAHRLSHWAIAHGIISPEQVGFMAMQGCEDQVLNLTETVRHYWAKKASTKLCAVFIDFKKAYDLVQPAALWHALRSMGLPEKLVSFLSTWSDQRRTTLTINGVQSEPWTMRMGVAQGDPLSPLLFNLYMESLIRHVKASPLFSGATVEHHTDDNKKINIKLLVYADDIVLVCESAEQASVGVALVKEWADAWGMELGLGAGKTEAMLFRRPGTQDPDPPPIPVPGTDQTVKWSMEYKYLGFMLRPDLNTDGLVERTIAKIQSNWNRYMHANPLLRSASPVLVLQLYRSCILGAANYLLALAEPKAAVLDHLDKCSKAVTRAALRLASRTPTELLWAEGKLSTGQAIMARERLRLYHKAKLTPLKNSILYRLAEITGSRPDKPGRMNFQNSWHSRTHDLLAKWNGELGVVAERPASYGDVSRAAAVTARAIALAEWKKEATSKWTKEFGDTPMPIDRLPTDEGKQTMAAAFFNRGYVTTTHELGTYKTCTPASVRGPGTSGGLLSSVTKRMSFRQWRILGNVRRGVEGWYDAFRTTPFNSEEVEAKKAGVVCPACNEADSREGPIHACCFCTGQRVVTARAALVETIPDFVHRLVHTGFKAMEREKGPGNAGETEALFAKNLALTQDWTTAEGRLLLYRLVTETTWPATSWGEQYGPLAVFLGIMWDKLNAKPHLMRPVTNAWAPWAASALLRMRSAYYAPADGVTA